MKEKKCLHCPTIFQYERDSAKFCSVNCRVLYNRHKPKVEKGLSVNSKIDMLCNSVMEMNAALKLMEQHRLPTTVPNNDVPIKETNAIITPAEWIEEKREIPDGDTETYIKWFNRLEACAYLNKHQKQLIKIT